MREYGSEHPAILLPDGYFEGLSSFDREMTYLRTGREALLYASYNCKPEKDAVILCPAYSCWSMIAPFELLGWTVIFYCLNEDLTIDEEYLDILLMNEKPDAILTMNFFGSASTKNAIAKVKAYNDKITVIEDFSHCTFCLEHIFNEQVDYYVTSIRKSLGICDGALTLSKNPTNKGYIGGVSSEFGMLRLGAQRLKGKYAVSKLFSEKNSFLSDIRQAEALIDNLDEIHPMLEISKKMLGIINGEEIAYARRCNMRHLWSLLNGKVNMVSGLERSFGGAPFSLPILVMNRDEVQKKLADSGVYAPVLWPIADKAREVCPVSANMADHMLSIPIDQRYDYDDIEDIARIVLSVIQ